MQEKTTFFSSYTFLDSISAIFSNTSLAFPSLISVYPNSLRACTFAVFNSCVRDNFSSFLCSISWTNFLWVSLILVLVIDVGRIIVLKQELSNISEIVLDYGLDKIDDNELEIEKSKDEEEPVDGMPIIKNIGTVKPNSVLNQIEDAAKENANINLPTMGLTDASSEVPIVSENYIN